MLQQTFLQKQSGKLLPLQIATLQIFQLDSLAIEQRIKEEILENPLLEENNQEQEEDPGYSKESPQDFQNTEESVYDDIPDYKMEYRNYLATESIPQRHYADITDFRDEIKNQFRLVANDPREYEIGAYIIDSLNDKGFLELDLESIVENLSFREGCWVEKAEIENVLRAIRRLDPPGIGSRNIQEYLLLQLKALDSKRPWVKEGIALLEHFAENFRNFNVRKMQKDLNLAEGQLEQVLQLINALKKCPVAYADDPVSYRNFLCPDFILNEEDGNLTVSLSRERSSSLFVNFSMIDRIEETDKAARQFIKSKMASATWFINAVKEREANMMLIMKAILKYQEEYFLSGDLLSLKPMTLKNISSLVGLDISSVSRIISNKYLQCPWGNIHLKILFTEGLKNVQGENISNRVIRKRIVEIVEMESKENPLSDIQLAQALLDKGYKVARRTVVKYRERENIPISRLRKNAIHKMQDKLI